MKRGSKSRRESSAVRRYKALTAKKPSDGQLPFPILRVVVHNDYAIWSLEYNVASHLFMKKLELIKNRIFLKYGYGSKFFKAERIWRTNREVGECVKQDKTWYEEQGIEVMLDFKAMK